jgi:hypothetical protein
MVLGEGNPIVGRGLGCRIGTRFESGLKAAAIQAEVRVVTRWLVAGRSILAGQILGAA